MNALYANSIDTGSTADPLYFNPDLVKFDPSSCYTGSTGQWGSSTGYDPSSALQRHGYNRLPQLEVRSSSVHSKTHPGYSTSSSSSIASNYCLDVASGSSPYTPLTTGVHPLQNGHYVDLERGDGRPASNGVRMAAPRQNISSAINDAMVAYGGSGHFGSMLSYEVTGHAPPPIYPWMRSFCAGKQPGFQLRS